jgi:hypothetical protein
MRIDTKKIEIWINRCPCNTCWEYARDGWTSVSDGFRKHHVEHKTCRDVCPKYEEWKKEGKGEKK